MAISNTKPPAGNLSAASKGTTAPSGTLVGPKTKGAEAAESQEKTTNAVASASATAIRSAAASYGKQNSSPATSPAANVTISEKARELNLAKSIAENTPEVREDKVAEFKKLIASGNYKPDAGKIADGILREAIKDDLSSSPDLALE